MSGIVAAPDFRQRDYLSLDLSDRVFSYDILLLIICVSTFRN